MDSDYNESLVTIFFVPFYEIWESSLTVDARICPKIDNHHLSSKRLHREWMRVYPLCESYFWGKIWIFDIEHYIS
jgi:hypothetical protein